MITIGLNWSFFDFEFQLKFTCGWPISRFQTTNCGACFGGVSPVKLIDRLNVFIFFKKKIETFSQTRNERYKEILIGDSLLHSKFKNYILCEMSKSNTYLLQRIDPIGNDESTIVLDDIPTRPHFFIRLDFLKITIEQTINKSILTGINDRSRWR